MPLAKLPIPNTSNTVVRSITRSIVSDLKNNLGMDNSAFIQLENLLDVQTVYSGVNVSLVNNVYESPVIEKVSAKITNNKINDYNVLDRVNPSKIVFLKNKYIEIGTEYVNSELIIDITYQTKSKTNSDEMAAYLRNHYLYSNDGYMHKLDFYTEIPKGLLGMIEDVYTTGNVNYDSGLNFLEFIKEANVVNAIKLSSDVNGLGGDVGLVVMGSLINIHGQFDSDLREVKAEYDKENNSWDTTLSYRVNYMMPEMYHIDFSVLVNNTMLPDLYYTQRIAHNHDKTVDTDLFDIGYTLTTYREKYLAIPPYDNHKPTLTEYRYSYPLCSILSSIELLDLKTLFNLTDLVYYEITTPVVSYMKTNHIGMTGNTGLYDSIFYLELYKDNRLTDSRILTVDTDLNVSSTIDLDITSSYRVVLCMITDLNMLSDNGRNSLIGIDFSIFDTVLQGLGRSYRGISGLMYTGFGSKSIIPVSTPTRLTAQVSIIQTLIKPLKG